MTKTQRHTNAEVESHTDRYSNGLTGSAGRRFGCIAWLLLGFTASEAWSAVPDRVVPSTPEASFLHCMSATQADSRSACSVDIWKSLGVGNPSRDGSELPGLSDRKSVV